MLRRFFVVSFYILSICMSAQAAPDTLWTQLYPTDSGQSFRGIIALEQGGFIAVNGEYASSGYVYRINDDGGVAWNAQIECDSAIQINSLCAYSDDEFFIAGMVSQGFNARDGWCARMTAAGDTLWTRSFRDSLRQELNSVAALENTIFCAGYTRRDSTDDAWLLALDMNGDSLWTRSWDFGGDETINDVLVTADGNLLLAGRRDVDSEQDGLVLYCNSQGDTLWSRVVGGLSYEILRDAVETNEGDFVFTGYRVSATGENNDVWLLKMNPEGDIVWSVSYGGDATDSGRELIYTPDDCVIVAGATHSTDDNNHFYITKRNSSGTGLWSYVTDDIEAFDVAYSIAGTPDGGFIVGGSRELLSSPFEMPFLMRFEGLRSDFYSDIQAGDTPLEVQFYSTSTGNVMQWDWDFDGDGVWDGTGPLSSWTYENAGNFDVTLRISDGTNYSSLTREGYIQVELNSPPEVVSFSPEDTLLAVPLGAQIHFTVSASDDNNVLHYSWWVDGNNEGVPYSSFIDNFNVQGVHEVLCAISDTHYATEVRWRVEVGLAASDSPEAECATGLLGGFPNPFNPSTCIRYRLQEAQHVRLDIYNARGQRVRRLYSGYIDAGMHKAAWNGMDEHGKTVSTGIYYIVMKVKYDMYAKKLLMIK